MTLRRSLITALLAHVLMACGGQASQTGTGGAGGAASGLGSGGYLIGGTDAGGTLPCCSNIIVECPAGERPARDGECPGLATCNEMFECCGAVSWCVPDPRVCPAGAAGAAGAGETGPTHDCNGTPCTASQACIAYETPAAFAAPSAGCPTDEHLAGSICQSNFAYKCAELCGACQNQPVTCACAQPTVSSPGVCPAGDEACSESGANVDSSAQVICRILVK